MPENCRKPLATRVDFTRLTTLAAPPDACAEMRRIGRQAAWEWRRRPFAAVDGRRGRIVPRGRAWVDGTYANDTDPSHGCGQARKRGPSRQRMCIAVGIDARREPVAAARGHGKPSSARIRKAMKAHVAEGSTLVHDRERAHNALARESSLGGESHKADARDPAHLGATALVNSLCSRVKRHLWRLAGMDPANLQSYLNLYVHLFRVERDDEGWPGIARVACHPLMTGARFRSST